jgi:hypothetical protein
MNFAQTHLAQLEIKWSLVQTEELWQGTITIIIMVLVKKVTT